MIVPEVVHEHFLKVPVVQREDFEILLEQHVSGTFVHCNVKNYNATVKREIMACWSALTQLHGGPIYALHDLPDHKHRKFLCLFGFKRHQVLPNLKELWIWRPVYG
jgi:hypothetical protein